MYSNFTGDCVFRLRVRVYRRAGVDGEGVTMNQYERFWGKVDRRGPDECWPWTGGTNSRGYGRLRWDKEPELANRVAWIIAHGPIAPGAYVLMNCGNPLCCNVAHMTITEGKPMTQYEEDLILADKIEDAMFYLSGLIGEAEKRGLRVAYTVKLEVTRVK